MSCPTLCVVWLALKFLMRIPSLRKQRLACRLTGTHDINSRSEVVVLLVDPGTVYPLVSSSSVYHNRTSKWRGSASYLPLREVTRMHLLSVRASWNQEALWTSIEKLRQSAPSIARFHFCHSRCDSRCHEPARRFAIHRESRNNNNILVVGIPEVQPLLQ